MNASSSFASIGIVLPYFGKLPNYFPLFLESCRQNSTIDWLLYTDCEDDMPYPDNFKVTRMTFSDFRQRIQNAFDFPISLESPYKLCDFKPTYGDTLADDLVGYDFWGHCDCDLIFGNIRKFITKNITDQYDRIGNCGHLILYRNTPSVNRYYREQTYLDYKTVLQSSNSHSFDEWPGISSFWQLDSLPCFGTLCFDDITVEIEEFKPVQVFPGGFIGPYHGQPDESVRFSKMNHIIYSYDSGKLYRCWVQGGTTHQEEIMYVHFQKRKMQIEVSPFSTAFIAVPNAFISSSILSVDFLRNLAPKSKNRTAITRFIKNWIKIIMCEIKNIGKQGYYNNSVIANYVNTYIIKKYQ